MTNRDFHGYKRRLEKAIENINASGEISDRNRNFALEFLSRCQAEGISVGRLARYAQMIGRISVLIGKDFDLAKRRDIELLVAKIELREDFKQSTKHLYRVAIKKFYKWLNNGEYPDIVKWLKCTDKSSGSKLPEEILTEEEVKKLIETAEHPRDKALVSVIYESGFRIGELAGIRLKHIVFDEYGCQLIVDGKTGMRRIRLIASTPYLSVWFNMHPRKNNPEEALWINIGTSNHGKEMSYQNYVEILRNLALKAKITKKVNPHAFRHARATHLSKHLKEFQMKQYFGWTMGSDVPQTYVHLSGRDMDDSLLQIYGIKKKEEKSESPLMPKTCPICGTMNEATSCFCGKCARPLDTKSMLELEEKRKTDENFSLKIINTPGVLDKFLETASEKDIGELIKIHPNLTQQLTVVAVRNIRRRI